MIERIAGMRGRTLLVLRVCGEFWGFGKGC